MKPAAARISPTTASALRRRVTPLLQTLIDLDFSRGGNGRKVPAHGWFKAGEEAVGSAAEQCRVVLHGAWSRDAGRVCVLEIDMAPVQLGGALRPQRVEILVNGQPLAEEVVSQVTRSTYAYVLPRPAGNLSAPLRLELHLPDAVDPKTLGLQGGLPRSIWMFRIRVIAVPADTRPAGAHFPALSWAEEPRGAILTPAIEQAIRTQSGMAPADLALRFENLGERCEFGFMQRHLGAEPIGLLRFNLTRIPCLLDGLESGFEGVDDPGLIGLNTFDEPANEYFLTHARYQFKMHTRRLAHVTDVADVRAEMLRSIGFMKEKFRHTLAEAEKIFVYKRREPMQPAHMRAVQALLRCYGRNTLLFVTEEDARAPGTVDDLGGGLLHGALAVAAPKTQVDDFDLRAWASICVNAVRAVGC